MVKRVRGRKRGHHLGVLLEVSERIMSLPQYVWKTALGLCLGWLAATPVHAQSYTPQGAEFAIAGALPGDQIYPAASLNPSGGYLVWEDNITDGSGQGVSALRLDGNLSGALSSFRVNQQAAEHQERPQVSLLNDGGAVFVWQGGRQGFQDIYARFLGATGTWITDDVLVNAFTNHAQIQPVVTTLTNGQVIMVWGSFNQRASDSLQDIYLQRFAPGGQKLGGEIAVNQFAAFNQRTPAVAALSDGRFVVVWVSEQQRNAVGSANPQQLYQPNQLPSVDIYARIFQANGQAAGGEFLVNTGTNVCANPAVAAAADGGFLVVWSEKDVLTRENSWDIFSRPFTSAGTGGVVRRVNTHTFGDQFAPRISSVESDYLVVWTSLGQDGSREGVYAQFLNGGGALVGAEFRVNTTTVSQQMHPTVAADGLGRFLVAWTSFSGGVHSFDLQAQRYVTVVQPLLPMDAPFVVTLNASELQVSWSPVAGLNVTGYEVYANGSASPTATVTNNWWTMTGLAPASTNHFRVAYVLADGRRSPLSESTSGWTYGEMMHYDVIPFDWMKTFWGGSYWTWPSPSEDSDGDGASNYEEFLAGTNPLDAGSVLKQQLQQTPQGLFLTWNTQPGLLYQVQVSINLGAWQNLGGPRLAAGTSDSLFVGHGSTGYYRVIRVR